MSVTLRTGCPQPLVTSCLEAGGSSWLCVTGQFAGAAEVLQYTGVTSFAEPRWWNVGAAKLSGEDLNYLGVSGLRIAGGQGILIIAFCQVGAHANACYRMLSP